MAARVEARRAGLMLHRRRLMLLTLVAIGLVPGTWARTEVPAERSAALSFIAVEGGTPREWPDGLTVERVWEMTSPDPFFGGYSALLPLGEGRVRAFSDRGDSLSFDLPGPGADQPLFAAVEPDPRFASDYQDIESVAYDPATGRHWLGYEQFHGIRRFVPDDPEGTLTRPAQMRKWSRNSGAEAMVRLADGRFLVLGERGGVGLIFAGDPVEVPQARKIAIAYPQGFRPTDAALLPDGRVLVLMRRVERAWPPFSGLLAIGDPADITGGKPWPVRPFARLNGPLPRENYEALVVEAIPETDGDSLVLWLLSDDNLATFQRTLLIKLRWRL